MAPGLYICQPAYVLQYGSILLCPVCVSMRSSALNTEAQSSTLQENHYSTASRWNGNMEGQALKATPWALSFGLLVELAQTRVHSHCDGTASADGIGCVAYTPHSCQSHLQFVDGG